MLKAIVISNAIHGIEDMFISNKKVQYTFYEVSGDFDPDLSGYDVLIVPNGSDQVAMHKIKDRVKVFLDGGNSLFCFDGWFTSWIPKNQWIMDNSKKTIDVRYHIEKDRYGLFNNLQLDKFIFSHGMSGWWACGYIEANPEADVLLTDTWNRPVIVIDEVATEGFMFLTASGPLADTGYSDEKETNSSWSELSKFYGLLIDLVISKKEKKLHLQNN